MKNDLKILLDIKVDAYNQPFFISGDPVSIPHMFSKTEDIEIAGFFAAIFAWGNRTTIISKCRELMGLMDNAPHDFCMHAGKKELKGLFNFKHRTFNTTDLLYFIEFFRFHYSGNESLETAFTRWMKPSDETIENALNGFRHYFFSLPDVPGRTKKHIASPDKNASCKRLSMFLRWMVRSDDKGVDFGIWKNISPAQLVCPLDLHVQRVAQKLGLLQRKQPDWKAVTELTENLRTLDAEDPVKYDFALFGLGVFEKHPHLS